MVILKKMIFTEKASKFQTKGVYSFVVDKDANKLDVKTAVEKKYKVLVDSVNTMIYGVKRKYFRTRFGASLGKTSAYKKAIVKLREGQFINLA
jgi:large subunit ribosomal protein L23